LPRGKKKEKKASVVYRRKGTKSVKKTAFCSLGRGKEKKIRDRGPGEGGEKSRAVGEERRKKGAPFFC